MPISRKEELEINESSLIKEMLICELKEIEKAVGFKTISTEKELVNYALISLLQIYKKTGNLEGTVISLSNDLEYYFKQKFQVKQLEDENFISVNTVEESVEAK